MGRVARECPLCKQESKRKGAQKQTKFLKLTDHLKRVHGLDSNARLQITSAVKASDSGKSKAGRNLFMCALKGCGKFVVDKRRHLTSSIHGMIEGSAELEEALRTKFCKGRPSFEIDYDGNGREENSQQHSVKKHSKSSKHGQKKHQKASKSKKHGQKKRKIVSTLTEATCTATFQEAVSAGAVSDDETNMNPKTTSEGSTTPSSTEHKIVSSSTEATCTATFLEAASAGAVSDDETNMNPKTTSEESATPSSTTFGEVTETNIETESLNIHSESQIISQESDIVPPATDLEDGVGPLAILNVPPVEEKSVSPESRNDVASSMTIKDSVNVATVSESADGTNVPALDS